ncbi:MacB-like periplasmic core domain protein (plasmid) [Gemmatirosa kalamazoonensis]|uniref:MacB-like periplasmic core domain protein n=1 Tax=Gemmatirosa kalamazoonensis TaxID=861299 RepID=W0RRU4_9BACT|nr:ABC transporter permease [Gemmatirosa kalamazoonensis]AHG93426.1 MacB-like periplasmic core domain protein [Gemmatirosa kalamazoonensis]
MSVVGIVRGTLSRLRATLRGHDRADDELRAEMEAHLAMATEEYVRRGLPPDEARRRALVESGGLTQAARLVHAQRGLPWIERLAADASYAVRHFRHTPMATVTMLLVLSLGLGTNVVLFTVMNSLATLPAPGIARDAALVRVRGSVRATRTTSAQARLLSWPEVQAYAARTELFDRVAAHANETALVDLAGAPSDPVAARVVFVTPNYFDVLGVRPALGTVPPAEPDVTRLTTSPTAVISDAMWRRRFGGARDVIGRVVRINEVPVEIVGVAPPRFVGTGGGAPGSGAMTMWVPLAAYPLLQKRTAAVFAGADSLFLSAFARLRPGVTTAAAAPVVAAIAARARADSIGADVVPMRAANSRVSQQADQIVSAALAGGFALLVLLVTCTNVSALMVGLAVARRREIGVRLALGAPRTRLIRQLLTESVLLSLAAAAVGLAVTALGIRVAGAALEDVQLVVDWRVTAATCAVALVTGVLFGLSPALHATRVSVGEVMKGVARTTSAARSRLQSALVVVQIALTQPLLVGLGVVIVTMLAGAADRTPSAVSDRIAEVELDPWAGRVSPDVLAARIDAVVARVGAVPGVVAAVPMQMGTIGAPLVVHPHDRVPGVAAVGALDAQLTAAPRGYFAAFGVHVVRGRDFTDGERAPATHDPARPLSYDVVIVASDIARRLWGAADPLGRRLVIAGSDDGQGTAMTVVGVVDAAAPAGPNDDAARVRVYVPYATMNTGVLARTTGPAAPMLDALRRAVAAEAPQLPIVRAQTMAEREAAFRRDVLRAGGAAAGGGLLALLLSAMGLYAVVSFAVAQRTAEIGIRTALGAGRGQVVRMFFARGLALSASGLVVGLPLSVLAARYAVGALHWSPTRTPVLGVAIGLVVLAVAAAAVWIPARRASAVDPIVALRTE